MNIPSARFTKLRMSIKMLFALALIYAVACEIMCLQFKQISRKMLAVGKKPPWHRHRSYAGLWAYARRYLLSDLVWRWFACQLANWNAWLTDSLRSWPGLALAGPNCLSINKAKWSLDFVKHINQHSVEMVSVFGPYFISLWAAPSKVCKWGECAMTGTICLTGRAISLSFCLSLSLSPPCFFTVLRLKQLLQNAGPKLSPTLRVFASCHLIFKIEFWASFYLSPNGMEINVLLSKRPICCRLHASRTLRAGCAASASFGT